MANPEEKIFEGGAADETEISLSQAILAPLDSLFKAQMHAARSFINLLFQIGYPHIPIDPKTNRPNVNLLPEEERKGAEIPFALRFKYPVKDPNTNELTEYEISIPALALVPLNSLAIESGEFRFGLSVTTIDKHEQLQESRRNKDKEAVVDSDKRPWFLVQNPVSMRGKISSSTKDSNQVQREATIDIQIKLSKSPTPAALNNLLTTLTQNSSITPK